MHQKNNEFFMTAFLGLFIVIVGTGLAFLVSKNNQRGEIMYSDAHTTVRKVEIEGHEYLINSRGGIEKIR